jgi:hypothetical protein
MRTKALGTSPGPRLAQQARYASREPFVRIPHSAFVFSIPHSLLSRPFLATHRSQLLPSGETCMAATKRRSRRKSGRGGSSRKSGGAKRGRKSARKRGGSSSRSASKRGGARRKSASRKSSSRKSSARKASSRSSGRRKSSAKRSSSKRSSRGRASGRSSRGGGGGRSVVSRARKVAQNVAKQAQSAVSAGLEAAKDLGEGVLGR